jgi:O-antigen/teichoic acid export membrane protein
MSGSRTIPDIMGPAAWTAGTQVAGTAMWIVASLVAARSLGPAGNGALILSLNEALIASSIAGFSIAGLIAANIASGRLDSSRAATFAWIHGALGGLAAALVLRALRVNAAAPEASAWLDVWFVGLVVGALLTTDNLRAILIGRRMLTIVNIQSLITTSATAAGWLWCWRHGSGVGAFFAVWGAGRLLGLVPCAAGLLMRRECPPTHANPIGLVPLVARSAVLHGGTVALALLSRATPFLIEKHSPVGQVGLYAVASAVAARVGIVSYAMATSQLGIVGRAKDDDSAWEVLADCSKVLVPLLVVGCLALGLAGPLLLQLVLGPEYRGVGWVVVALLPGQLAYAILFSLVQAYLLARHNDVLTWTAALWAGVAVMVPAVVAGSALMGGFGGALGESFGFLTALLVATALTVRRHGRNPMAFLIPRRFFGNLLDVLGELRHRPHRGS